MKEKEWILLRLDLTENSEENKSIYKKYSIVGLPTLVLLSPQNKEKQIKGLITTSELIQELENFTRE